MQVLVRRDDRRGDLRAREQLAIVARDELGLAFVADELGAIRFEVGNADPVDGRMPRGDLAAEQADAPGANDGETDALGRTACHQAAARSDAFRGSVIASLRSAEISAAM